MRVAVVGGTGTVGRRVVAALRTRDVEPVVVARSTGVDLATGRNLVEALAGSQAVIDVSNVATTSRRRSVAFFRAAAHQLLDACRQVEVGHLVTLSIVGIEHGGLGYYAGKVEQERIVLAGPVPVTVLRATQFHEFVAQVVSGTPGPVAVVPRMLLQPIAAAEVAQALSDLALEGAAGRVADLAGPQVHELVDLARLLLRRTRSRRLVVPVRLPGQAGRALSTGSLLPVGAGPRGRQTFAQWLDELHPSTPSDGAHGEDLPA